MAVNLARLFHIEIVVADAEESYRFLKRVFDAKKVEEHIPAYLEEVLPGCRVIHVELGGVVLQLVEPTDDLPSWQQQLKEKGPSVHNLTFLVDDLEKAVETLESEGAKKIWSIDLEKRRVFGEDVTGEMPVHMVDAIDKVGFRFELAEMPKEE